MEAFARSAQLAKQIEPLDLGLSSGAGNPLDRLQIVLGFVAEQQRRRQGALFGGERHRIAAGHAVLACFHTAIPLLGVALATVVPNAQVFVVGIVAALSGERTLTVRILITPADGSAPFPLVLSVDAVTAQVLNDADLG